MYTIVRIRQHDSKIFPQKLLYWEIILGDNGGDRKKMYVTISGTEIFLDNNYYQKLDNYLFKLTLCVIFGP